MPGDDFAFDAYDRLVSRRSMVGSPVSVIARNPPLDRLNHILERSLSLLAGRRLPDEIVLLVAREPESRPPATCGAVAIRTVVHSRTVEKEGLEWALANARWPLVVFAGEKAELPLESFWQMLESLEHADIVVGRRRTSRGRWNPLGWLIRRLFGVAVSDPLSPYLAARRETLAGIPLELEEPLTTFELLAKATFSFAIYDETEIPIDEASTPPLSQLARTHWRSLVTLLRRPTFWRFSPGGQLRVTPQETRPPGIDAIAPIHREWKALHPLQSANVLATRSPWVRPPAGNSR